MSKLKEHYVRNLEKYGNLAISHKTEVEVQEIVEELKELGYDVDYKRCEDIPLASTLVASSIAEKYYAERQAVDWTLSVRTVK